MSKDLAWLEISRSALKHNLELFKKIANKKTLVAPAVKANAYGHGLAGSAKIFLNGGADWLCINSLEEAEILRRNRISCPILMMGRLCDNDLKKILAAKVKIFIDDLNLAEKISRLAVKNKKIVAVHLKIDSGMGRQGVLPDEAIGFAQELSRLPRLKIEGLATHFATADETDNQSCFIEQFLIFERLISQTEKLLGYKLIKSCANSAAAMLYPQARFDLIRPGIAAYGYYPSLAVKKIWEKKNPALRPSLSFKTRVSLIKIVPAGSCVSYGCTFITKKKTTLALLPIGYYDGLDRGLSNCGEVLIRGRRAPIVGRVCMNLTVVDVSQIPGIKISDEAVIIGRQGDNSISVEEVADKAKTINYEIITRLRESLPRYYV